MTQEQYNEACKHANKQLTYFETHIALEELNRYHFIPFFIRQRLQDAMEEYCKDNGLDEDSWTEYGTAEDVFLNCGKNEGNYISDGTKNE